MHTLTSSHLRLWLDSDIGVSWCALQVFHDNRWVHLMPDCRGQDDTGPAAGLLAASSFVMLPYCNRVRDGRFDFDGTAIQLAEGDRHAMHGALRKLPWQVEQVSDTRLRCHFDSRQHEQRGYAPINWPWPIVCTLEHTLDGRSLRSDLRLTNRGDTDMPAGLGWHPYFLREVEGAAPALTVPVTAVFPDNNGDCLPTGPAEPLPDALNFREERGLDPAQAIDHCFAGLEGDCRIRWPEANIGLTLSASAECRFAVVYNPNAPFFAVEPVTNANDAFNLEAQGIDAGQHVLSPGQSLRASMTLQLDA